jgi:hypothetical protein
MAVVGVMGTFLQAGNSCFIDNFGYFGKESEHE